jgi:hypothetical protein
VPQDKAGRLRFNYQGQISAKKKPASCGLFDDFTEILLELFANTGCFTFPASQVIKFCATNGTATLHLY